MLCLFGFDRAGADHVKKKSFPEMGEVGNITCCNTYFVKKSGTETDSGKNKSAIETPETGQKQHASRNATGRRTGPWQVKKNTQLDSGL